MLISTKGRYAMRFMIDLALRGPEEKVSLREIAEFEGISLKYLEQLVRPLTQFFGLVVSQVGKCYAIDVVFDDFIEACPEAYRVAFESALASSF